MSITVTKQQAAERYVLGNDTSTGTIPAFGSRDSVLLKNDTASDQTWTAYGSDTVDGLTSIVLGPYGAVELIRGLTEWKFVSSFERLNSNSYTNTAYGAGTVYTLTNTAAAVDFGTTDPAIVLAQAGTYLLFGQVHLAYAGATVVAETATLKVRRTNNTAADLSAVVVIDLPVATTLTNSYGIVSIPPFVYTTTAVDDAVTLFANVSAGLGVGTITATAIGTSIVAYRIE
jgi:hypothetical protein